MSAAEGMDALRTILRSPPTYPLSVRCVLAFFSASLICVISFGGSIVDMFISGLCASVLQYLGLSAASKSSMYANVYEYVYYLCPGFVDLTLFRISVSIIVAFVARGLSNAPGNIFCYSAISSAGTVSILPGFTIRESFPCAVDEHRNEHRN